jgi:hypothetical protein
MRLFAVITLSTLLAAPLAAQAPKVDRAMKRPDRGPSSTDLRAIQQAVNRARRARSEPAFVRYKTDTAQVAVDEQNGQHTVYLVVADSARSWKVAASMKVPNADLPFRKDSSWYYWR